MVPAYAGVIPVSVRNITEEQETGYTETEVLKDIELSEIPPFDWSDYKDFASLYVDSKDEWEITVEYTESDGDDWWKEKPTESYTASIRDILTCP